MCATDDSTVHLATETTYDAAHPFGSDGYRTNCRDVPFADVLYVRESDDTPAWFSLDAPPPQPVRLSSLTPAWSVSSATLGSFTGHGAASTASAYELAVCDAGWMWTGLQMTARKPGCAKQCGDWCGDTTGVFFRYDGDFPAGGFRGVAFNENGHAALPPKLMSVGLRRRAPNVPAAPGLGGYAKQACVHVITPGPCEDGNPCTADDACELGACVSGASVCDIAVTAADDTYDGECSAQHCSLREALAVANASSTATTIGIAVADPIVLASNGQDVLGNTTIIALGDRVTIDGDGKYRAFRFAGDFTLRHLRFVDGSGQTGGAIAQMGGTLTLEDVVFENNHAVDAGGAVWTAGKLDVRECSFVSNSAVGAGGALFVAKDGTSMVRRSSFEQNDADSGGAISVEGTAAVVNCSLIANTSAVTGGGVAGSGQVELIQSTLVGNTAPTGSACSADTFDALNSLFVAPATPTGLLCLAEATDALGSAATDLSCGTSYADNLGGVVLIPAGAGTMAAFEATASVVDAADTLTCQDPRVEGVDQYGAPRPLGAACDVGAFEYYSDFKLLLP